MDRWRGKVAIVTGASQGIGRCIVENLVKDGVNVVGVARSIDKLQQIQIKLNSAPGKVYPMQCDVSKEDEILNVFSKVESTFGGIDILVNNAAVLIPKPILDDSTENYRKILDVNVLAVAICTREAVKLMRKRNVQGHIININSVAGHLAEIIHVPISLYSASKYAITGMTASLRNELNAAKTNIKITSISPGAVKTDMIVTAGIPKTILDKVSILNPEDVANAVIYVLGTPKNVQINEMIITPVEELGLPK